MGMLYLSHMREKIKKALNWRYAVKIFDPKKTVSRGDLDAMLEAGRLAPSSYGIEPWKFIVVENSETRKKLREASYDQPKVTDASHIVVIARRTDVRENISSELALRTAKTQGKDREELEGLKNAVDKAIAGRSDEELDAWVRAQVYIPLGMMIEAAALIDIDTGPMEGFQPDKADEILDLPKQNLRATVMLAIGHRGDDEYATLPKTRRSFDEVVAFVE